MNILARNSIKLLFMPFNLFKRVHNYLLKKIYKVRIIESCKSYKEPLQVNGKSCVNTNTTLGQNVNFNGMMIYGGGEVIIGDNFHSGIDCQMITSYHNFDTGTLIPYDHSNIDHKIVIGDNVWLGNNVMVLGGVFIGEGAIIQAGSVVTSDVEKYSIAGGHPAKVFSKRDSVHYEKLKVEGKFV